MAKRPRPGVISAVRDQLHAAAYELADNRARNSASMGIAAIEFLQRHPEELSDLVRGDLEFLLENIHARINEMNYVMELDIHHPKEEVYAYQTSMEAADALFITQMNLRPPNK